MRETSPARCGMLMPNRQAVVRHSATAAQNWSTAAMEAWEACLGRGTAGAVHLHPRLVLSDMGYYRDSQLFTLPGDGDVDGQLRGLAVLAPCIVNIRTLPLGWGIVRVNGYRLVADQIIGTDAAVVVQLARAMTQLLRDREAEALLFEDVECNSALWKAVHQVAAEQRQPISLWQTRPPQLRHLIRFPDPPADYWKKFSSKTRNTLRRKAAKFEHRVVRFTTVADVPAFLERAQNISAKSWQESRLGRGVRNSTEKQKYFAELARLGAFRSYVLEHQGTPAAFVIGTCWNNCFFYEDLAFDQSYLEHSPGTILLFRILEDLIAQDTPRGFDFGDGHQEYKQLFGTHQTQSGPLLLVRRPNPAIYLQIERLWRLGGRAARAVFRRIGIHRYLRRHRRRLPKKQRECG